MGMRDWLFGKKDKEPKQHHESSSVHDPPTARRVAERAHVLATVICRAFLEIQRDTIEDAEGLRGNLLAWLASLDISAELEPHELALLQSTVGHADEKATINASWRGEGLAVLAWALRCFELPAYDVSVFPPDPVQERIGFMNAATATALLDGATLRGSEEISRFASHMTIVNWRLRQFGLSRGSALYRANINALHPFGHGVGERMDFVGYLSVHPAFKDYWLHGLRFVEKDLAIGNSGIADASPEEVQRCTSIANERQIAAYWLRGDHLTYSKVDPATLLMAC